MRYGCLVKVVKHFQSIFRLSACCSKSRCYMKTDHSGSWNADAHTVLQNVAAYLDVKPVIGIHSP